MRWPWLLVLACLAGAIPAVQACTAPPPMPVNDFDRFSWDGHTVMTTWAGREVTLVDGEWQIGAPVYQRGGCDPGPARQGTADPAGRWQLEYGDQHICCTGSWTLGPLRLTADDATLHEWTKHAGWVAFDSGVAVLDNGVHWIAYGPPDAQPRPALPSVARLSSDAGFHIGQDLSLMDMPTGQTTQHAYPASMGAVQLWWRAADGIVVGDGSRVAWFNGTFGAVVPVDGPVHVLRDTVLHGASGTLRAVEPDGGTAQWEASLHAGAAGPASSAIAVWSQQVPQVWILEGVQVLAQHPMPREMPGTTASGTQTMYGASATSSVGSHDGTTQGGDQSSGQEIPFTVWAPFGVLCALLVRRRW